MKPIVLKFDLTEQDYIEFNYYYWITLNKKKRRKMYLWAIGPILFFLLLIIAFKGFKFEEYKFTEFVLILWGFLLCFLFMPASKAKIRKMALAQIASGKNSGLLGSREIILAEDGVFTSVEYFKSEIQWEGFEKMEEDPKYFFIFMHTNNALIVPKRIFSDSNEPDALRNLVQSRIS